MKSNIANRTLGGLPLVAMFTQDRFRDVLGHLPTGVSIITAAGREVPTGMAANSVTSVSLDPPLILVCPGKSSSTWPEIREAGRFCVNITAAHHASLCRRFSMRGVNRFEGIGWHLRADVPALDDAVAWMDCRIVDEHDAGDHTIVVASVEDLDAAGHEPLVFFRGTYGTFLPA